jgi:hypothetical protein
VRILAHWVLEQELQQERAADGHWAAADLAAAAERAARKLGEPLSRLVGVDGCQALLKRALHLARAEYPLLEGVQPVATPVGGLAGLGAAVQGADPLAARDALAAVLAHLAWLLVTFLGADLTVRTMREVWSGANLDEIHLGGAAAAASEEATP